MQFNNLISILLLILQWCKGIQKPQLVALDIPDVSRLAVWRTKAYLISPSNPTSLLEVTWQPSFPSSSRVRRFPPMPFRRRCQGLEVATDVKTDSYGRLWVLDAGTDICPPKLLIFDTLIYRLNENIKYTFKHGIKFTHIAVDSGNTRHSSMAYLAGNDEIYAYSIYKDHSWPVKTSISGKITGLAINKGGLYQRSSLYIEVNNLELYQIFTSYLLDGQAPVENLGLLLGPNYAGIISDNKCGIYYTLARDYVALKWDSTLPLQAESHTVIFQSYSLLNNVTYFTHDSHKNIWALVKNGTDDTTSWCIKLNDLQVN